MEKRFSKIVPQPWVGVALLLGFCVVVYFINLGQWDLWNPDEPRYAQVAKEMVTGGDWVLMHYNGEVYSDKPPSLFLVNCALVLSLARIYLFCDQISCSLFRNADSTFHFSFR